MREKTLQLFLTTMTTGFCISNLPMKKNHFTGLLLTALLSVSQSFAQSGDGGNFTPANPPEMQPIANHNTPAYREAKLFLRGANLGDYLEANRRWRNVTVSAD